MAVSISTSTKACLQALNTFINDHARDQEAAKEGFIVETWQDELGRLRMWAANIGAHQKGQSSLDFRLRDASHIHQQIIKLLDDLLGTLRDAQDVLVEDGSDADDGCSDSSMDDEDSKTEIQQFEESLAITINCLFQMSMLVRKPGQRDLVLGSKIDKVDYYESVDVKHVSEKYPKADKGLVSRLGLANTLRRGYLGYRKRHALKLKHGIDNVDQDEEALTGTEATQYKPNIDIDDRISDSGRTQTSYAQTLMSGGNITIPSLPKASEEGLPFECPYCFFIITVQGTRSWNKHVFEDLQPYVCTKLNCVTAHKLYATRHEWLHHMKMVHPRNPTAHNADEESGSKVDCPLCKETLKSEKQYTRHVARHLQELALFVLPRSEEEQEVSDQEIGMQAGSSVGSASRPGSVHSDPALHPESDVQPDIEVDSEIPGERRGKTRMPRHLVNIAAITERGYPYEIKEGNIIIYKALDKDRIDEVTKFSREMNERESRMQRPTYIKVHRKHLSLATIEAYELPWEWDENDPNYMIIKQWIPEDDQEILFEHTRRIRMEEIQSATDYRAPRAKESQPQARTPRRRPRRYSPASSRSLSLSAAFDSDLDRKMRKLEELEKKEEEEELRRRFKEEQLLEEHLRGREVDGSS